MTPRETTLLTLLVATFLGAITIVGVGWFLDTWTLQAEQLARLKAEAVRLVASRQVQASDAEQNLRSLFVAEGVQVSTSDLAARLNRRLQDSGLTILEFRILSDGHSGWIQYSLQGSSPSWLRFLGDSSEGSPHLLFRNVAIRLREGSVYQFNVEVGYERIR